MILSYCILALEHYWLEERKHHAWFTLLFTCYMLKMSSGPHALCNAAIIISALGTFAWSSHSQWLTVHPSVRKYLHHPQRIVGDCGDAHVSLHPRDRRFVHGHHALQNVLRWEKFVIDGIMYEIVMQRRIDGCQMPDECDRKMEASVAQCNQTTEERRDDPRTCRGGHTEIYFVRVQRTGPKKKNLNPYI